MNLLEKINKCNEDELKDIIRIEIEKLNENCDENKRLGFKDGVLNNIRIEPHKGFISSNSEIKYSNYSLNVYKMDTNDYFYEFVNHLKKEEYKYYGGFN